MNKKHRYLSKQFFRGALVIALVVCMLCTMVPTYFISAKAEGTTANENLPTASDASSGNLASYASITANVDYYRPLTNLNNGDRYDDIWRHGLTTNSGLEDYYQFNWDTPVSVNMLTLWTTQGEKQAPTGWTIYVSEDGTENWKEVDSVSDLRWSNNIWIENYPYAPNNKKLESKSTLFDQQRNIKGLRIEINSFNNPQDWNGYAIHEIELYNVPDTQTSLALDKTSYRDGENLQISYTGAEGNDWIAIYKKGSVLGTDSSLAWTCTSRIQQPKGIWEVNTTEDWEVPGTYCVCLFRVNNTTDYEVLDQQEFEIEEALINTDKDIYREDDNIEISYKKTNVGDSFKIYLGDIDEEALVDSVDNETDLTDTWTKSAKDLNAGKHIAVLKDSNNTIIDQETFLVIKEGSIPSPGGVAFEPAGSLSCYADGTITVSPAFDESLISGYALYWGNSSGKLGDYLPIGVVAKNDGNSVTYQTFSNTIIPTEATCIMAYAVSSDGKIESNEYASVALNQERLSFGEEKYSFQVLSDVHVPVDSSPGSDTYDETKFAPHWGAALEDIKKNDSDSKGIFLVGDMTNNGKSEEYDAVKTIAEEKNPGLKLYYALGNHESYDPGNWEDTVNRFKEKTGMPNYYYAEEINGTRFVVLGSSTYTGTSNTATIDDTQFTWLEEQLQTAESSRQPIFVFLHESLYNTVYGSYPWQFGYRIEQSSDDKLREIFQRYPQTIFFTGHSHYDMSFGGNMYAGGGTMATCFNTAAVAYLYDNMQGQKDGSQGYYVEVYENAVLVRGRDFISGKWIPGAQFIVNLNENFKYHAEALLKQVEGKMLDSTSVKQLAEAIKEIKNMSQEEQSQYAELQMQLEECLERANLAYLATPNAPCDTSAYKMNDGDLKTTYWYSGTAEGEEIYYGYQWDTPVSVSQVVLFTIDGGKAGPTEWSVQVSKDGSTDWTNVGSITDVSYRYYWSKTREGIGVSFPRQNDIKGLRIQVKKANEDWSGHHVTEIEVYSNVNYALEATCTSNVTGIDVTPLNDGFKYDEIDSQSRGTGLWVSDDRVTSEGKNHYYQFAWNQEVSVNQVVLWGHIGYMQGPTKWSVQVSKDGSTDWREVASVNTSWEDGFWNTERRTVSFDLQKDIKGLRVTIKDKVVSEWKGYKIIEIECNNVESLGGNELKVVSYKDICTYRTGTKSAPKLAGYLFAGWYTDEKCTAPLSAETTKGAAYAKFVDSDVLTVKAQITAGTTANSSRADIRFVTTVDTLDYKEVGFEVTANGRTKSYGSNRVYKQLYAVNSSEVMTTYKPNEEFSPISNYFKACTVTGIPNSAFNEIWKVKSYWITLDGTTVYGKTAVKTISEGIGL